MADMGLDIDVAPAAMTPSMLDDVEEDPVAIAPEPAVEAEPEVEAAEWHPVAEAHDTPLEAMPEADLIDDRWPAASARSDAEVADEPVALEDNPAQDDDTDVGFASPYDQSDWSSQRPPFAPPVDAVIDAEDDQPEVALSDELQAKIADMDEADAALAKTIDPQAVEMLRHDMLAEIEALRAEIASLRSVQAHVPFVPAQAIDPEALKDCFTLIEERLSSLEFRAEEQDTALRRVLTLLVDWVEREDRMTGATQNSVAA